MHGYTLHCNLSAVYAEIILDSRSRELCSCHHSVAHVLNMVRIRDPVSSLATYGASGLVWIEAGRYPCSAAVLYTVPDADCSSTVGVCKASACMSVCGCRQQLAQLLGYTTEV
jgi:hypothetical protein